jgi:hypothetical protein
LACYVEDKSAVQESSYNIKIKIEKDDIALALDSIL